MAYCVVNDRHVDCSAPFVKYWYTCRCRHRHHCQYNCWPIGPSRIHPRIPPAQVLLFLSSSLLLLLLWWWWWWWLSWMIWSERCAPRYTSPTRRLEIPVLAPRHETRAVFGRPGCPFQDVVVQPSQFVVGIPILGDPTCGSCYC